MNPTSRKQMFVTLSLFLVILLLISGGLYFTTQFDKPDEDLEPLSAEGLESKAEKTAVNWKEDAELISLWGAEYTRDKKLDCHPGKCDVLLSPRDTSRNDGECYLWTYIYYSDSEKQFYKFGMRSDGEIVLKGRDYDAIGTGFYKNKIITDYIDSTQIAETATEAGGNSVLNQFPDAIIYYWLFTDLSGGPVWTVYYSYGGQIKDQYFIDGSKGSLLDSNDYINFISSNESLAVADTLANSWKSDAKLHSLSGDEIYYPGLGSSNIPGIYEGMLMPPDNQSLDGKCAGWVCIYISNQTTDLLKVYVLCSGETESEIITREKQIIYEYQNYTHYQDFIDSTEVIRIINETSNHPYFSTYYLYYTNRLLRTPQDETYSVWDIEWHHSPDLLGGCQMYGHNGTIIWGPY